MRVAILNSCRYIGGAELWQIRFARFLFERGDEARFFLRPGKFADLVEEERFKLRRIPMRFDLDPVAIGRLFFALRKFQPEVAIFNDQRDLRVGVIAADWAGVPLLIQRKGWSFLKGSFRDRFYYGRLDYLVAVSKAIEDMYRAKLRLREDRLYYLPNGVSPGRFDRADALELRRKIGADADEVLIGMVGRLERQKRQSDLIRAGKMLIERGAKIRILLAGEGRERENLAQLARDLGIAYRVSLLGFVDTIEEFLAGLDLFVFCSEWEGMPNAVLEALAAGKPVVGADIEGVREVVEDGKSGMLYPAGDLEALSERMERLIRDPGMAREMGEAARKRMSDNFDEQKLFREFRNWLKQRVKERR